ncbi:MAG: CRTAC1 family protein [Acidobacteriota bacterium]
MAPPTLTEEPQTVDAAPADETVDASRPSHAASTPGAAPRAVDDVSPDLDPEDDHDDAVIGKALRISAMVLAGIGALVAIGLLLNRDKGPPPAVEIETAAPVAVAAVAEAPTFTFTDVAASSGITFVHQNGGYGDKLLPETMGGGLAVLDYDGDGDGDVLFVDSGRWSHRAEGESQPALRLYRNDTAPKGAIAFTDVTTAAGLNALAPGDLYGMGVAVGDIESDGDVDLFITGYGANRLFENRGDGTFVDATERAGLAGDDQEWSTSAGFFDYDGDGDLDLMVCNYVRWSRDIDFALDFRLTGIGRAFGPPQNYEGSYPYLYRNEGDGTFVDVTAEAGLAVENPATGRPMAKALALAPVDVDRDGLLDVLVANDTVRNFFFHNQGDGKFEEMAELVGLAYDRDGNATGAMGIDVGYHRNDDDLGFLIGNFANEMSSVYVSQGGDPLFYVDEAIGEGIGAPSRRMLTFGLLLVDLDLDGRLDLFQANGHVESEIAVVDPSQAYSQPGQIFWNAGDLGFEPIDSAEAGDLAREIVGRGAAYADLDLDGDLDLVVTQISGAPLVLRNDQATSHHWLRLRLVERTADGVDVDAIGAWVEVTAGGVTQRRQVMPTRSYLSQVEPVLTFGLGTAAEIEQLRVTWRDGTTETLDPPSVDRQHLLVKAL